MNILSQAKLLVLSLALIVSAQVIAGEPSPRTFKVTNSTQTSMQIYPTARGWAQIGKGSGGNMAYSQTGVLDDEGKYRTLAPGESTTYQWDDMRMGFCISILVKFSDSDNFDKARPNIISYPDLDTKAAKAKNDANNAGCANQDIYITRDQDGPIATYNYTKPVDPQ